jgi:protoheme IX farnesyltransferase
MIIKTATYSASSLILSKIRAFLELVKFRLSLLVSFSSAMGYLLGNNGEIIWNKFFLFSIGGFLISGSAVTINQVLEREYDKVMKRTMKRPLPTLRVSVTEGLLFALVTFSAGAFLLAWYANMLTTILATISLALYAFIYTPLKRVGPIAVFVGAIPGAFPPLLGWIAATGEFSAGALLVFLIQFIWQFPHFWAIAWLADKDYKKAGFKLLPGDSQSNRFAGVQIMLFTLMLLPAGLLPLRFGLTGITSAIVVTIGGIYLFILSAGFLKNNTQKSALKIMYGSFLYLPLVLISLLIDKV